MSRTAPSKPLRTTAAFRVEGRQAERWDAVTGTIHPLPECAGGGGLTTIPLQFAPSESYFVVFPKPEAAAASRDGAKTNFVPLTTVATVNGPWEVSFDPAVGGPASVRFDTLEDWSRRPEPGIRYYSGIATYRNTFDQPPTAAPADLFTSISARSRSWRA